MNRIANVWQGFILRVMIVLLAVPCCVIDAMETCDDAQNHMGSEIARSIFVSLSMADFSSKGKKALGIKRYEVNSRLEVASATDLTVIMPIKGVTHFVSLHSKLLSDYCRPGGLLRKDYNEPSTVHIDNMLACRYFEIPYINCYIPKDIIDYNVLESNPRFKYEVHSLI